MRRSALLVCACVLTGCGAHAHVSAPQTSTESSSPSTHVGKPTRQKTRLASVLRLPLVRSRVLPGYLLVADRNNDRVILLSPDRRIVWQRAGFRQPDDAFFTPGFRGVITNEEFDDTLTQISLRTKRVVWRYGHAGIAGRAAGYLDAPDDAYRLPNGVTTVADIRNCRIVELRHDRTVLRVLGGSCVHDPPRGFASPNGDTPLPDGGMLVTEIGGWIDRLDRAGKLVWSVRTPFAYPSDAQLLPNGRILVCAFLDPGRVVEMTRSGRVTWSFGASTGRDRLDRPSLAIALPNGFVAINDDWRHRVIVVDPRTNHIVWQYGHVDVASRAPGYLDKPDGMDFLPASSRSPSASVPRPSPAGRTTSPESTKAPVLSVTRIGSLPDAISRLSAAVLPGGRIVVLGGLVAGRSSSTILAGPPAHLQRIGSLPAPTHDAAAVAVGPRRGGGARRRRFRLAAVRRPCRCGDRDSATSAPARRAALRSRSGRGPRAYVSGRRVHGHPLRQRRPPPRPGRPDHGRRPSAGRTPLCRSRCARRCHLRGRRCYDRAGPPTPSTVSTSPAIESRGSPTFRDLWPMRRS